jgi:hypothetical protein
MEPTDQVPLASLLYALKMRNAPMLSPHPLLSALMNPDPPFIPAQNALKLSEPSDTGTP